MVSLFRFQLIFLGCVFATSAQAATQVHLSSDQGDFIGGGQTYNYSDGEISASGNERYFAVNVGGWSSDFEAPEGVTFEPGMYAGAERYPFHSPARPGLAWGGNGRGCNRLDGWFEVLEIEHAGNQLVKLAVDFRQHCEQGNAGLFGAVRFNSDEPVPVARAYAAAGPDDSYPEGENILLDARRAYSLGGSIQQVTWTQVSGPMATIDSPNSNLTYATLDDVHPDGAELVFRVTVLDSNGQSDSDDITVTVISKSGRQTSVRITDGGGHYVSQGQDWFFTTANSTISAQRNFDNGLSFNIGASGSWNIDIAAPDNVELEIGRYEQAQRFPFQDAGRPGLSYSGDGRGCNNVAGSFEVIELEKENGEYQSALIEFTHQCEGNGPSAQGQVLLDAVHPSVPNAQAGSDQNAQQGQTVILNGGQSTDDSGALASYKWTQLSGTAVVLQNADSATANFTVDCSAVEEALEFELIVEDAEGYKSADKVTVTVAGKSASCVVPAATAPAPVATPSSVGGGSAGGGGGSGGGLFVIALGSLLVYRLRLQCKRESRKTHLS